MWAKFRNIEISQLISLVSEKNSIIGKLVAGSKETSFELRYRKEQLVEVERKILVLIIESDDCSLKFLGQRIIKAKNILNIRY